MQHTPKGWDVFIVYVILYYDAIKNMFLLHMKQVVCLFQNHSFFESCSNHIMCCTCLSLHVRIQFVHFICLFCLFFSLWSFCKCVDHNVHNFNLLVVFVQGNIMLFVLPFNITYAFICWWGFLRSFHMSTHLGASFIASQQLMKAKLVRFGCFNLQSSNNFYKMFSWEFRIPISLNSICDLLYVCVKCTMLQDFGRMSCMPY
jgi:hypothetical protein